MLAAAVPARLEMLQSEKRAVLQLAGCIEHSWEKKPAEGSSSKLMARYKGAWKMPKKGGKVQGDSNTSVFSV